MKEKLDFSGLILGLLVCIVILPGSAGGGAVGMDGLIGYWPMDESATTSGAYDSSGNGNNGTFVSNASTTAGKFGNGGVFASSTQDYIDMGVVSGWSNTEGTFSVWVRPGFDSDITANYFPLIWGMRINDNDRAYLYYSSVGDAWAFVLDTGPLTQAISSAQSFSAGDWVHITGDKQPTAG